MESLKDQDFVSKSFAGKDAPVSEFLGVLGRSKTRIALLTGMQALSSQGDILANVFWRFLQLRGYVDEKHQLTEWGTCLEQALSVLDPADSLEEHTFIAIELLRMGILSSKDWFSHVSGGPMRGSGKHVDFGN